MNLFCIFFSVLFSVAPSGLIQIYNENAIQERNLILVYSNDLKEKKGIYWFSFLQNNKNLFLPLTQSLFLHHHTLRDLHFCNKIIFIFWDPSALCFVQLQTLEKKFFFPLLASFLFHVFSIVFCWIYSRGISISTIHKHRKMWNEIYTLFLFGRMATFSTFSIFYVCMQFS